MSKIIMGIQQQQRHETSLEVQNLLTEYGCIIKTRLGVHQASDESCSEYGLILLEFIDNADDEVNKLDKSLSKIKNIVVKKMTF